MIQVWQNYYPCCSCEEIDILAQIKIGEENCLLNPLRNPLHSLIKIRVLKNDTWALASQLQRYHFEITL
jgi:hypothetical protein